MEWSDEVVGRLRALWAEGLSTAEIGRRMGISKNAVVGKAHRLNLAARPSPIRRGPADAPRLRPPPRRTSGPTLPPLPVAATPIPAQVAPRPVATASLRTIAAPWTGRSSPCCWPIGEPGTTNFRFCDANSVAGKPYCDTHAALAYVRVKDKRDDAA